MGGEQGMTGNEKMGGHRSQDRRWGGGVKGGEGGRGCSSLVLKCPRHRNRASTHVHVRYPASYFNLRLAS